MTEYHPFTVNCYRCEEERHFDSFTVLQYAILNGVYEYMGHGSEVLCDNCQEVLHDMRTKHGEALIAETVAEVEAHRAKRTTLAVIKEIQH